MHRKRPFIKDNLLGVLKYTVTVALEGEILVIAFENWGFNVN